MPTLTIVPPELLASSNGSGSGERKPYDAQEFLPNKMESGSSEEIRLLGTYATGHILAPWRCAVEEKQPDGTLRFAGYDYSTDYESFTNAARQTDWTKADRPKIEGEFVKPKRALCCLVYSYARDRVEVAIIEQRSLKDGLVEVLGDADFDFADSGIANFVLKVSKQGTGIETNYSVLPKPRKIEAVVKAAFEEVQGTAKMDCFLNGQHPLNKPRAEFDSSVYETKPSEAKAVVVTHDY